jgi:E3 ubiquitin-protein ligase BRE1
VREATEASTSNDKFKQLEEEDEDDANASAFYLKHQNRALASELRSVKYQLSRLERERDYRRKQCLDAVQSINALQAIWSQLESALCGDKNNGNGENSNSTLTTADASLAPLSTGSGTSVELIGAFINSLSRLGTANKNRISKIKGGSDDEGETKNNNKEEKAGDKMDVDDDDTAMESESMKENQALKELSRVSESVAERAAGLQSLIWSLLQKVEKSQVLNGVVSFSPPSSLELEDTVTRLQAENAILQERVDELGRSRDEITESDRRVRRGLYRLASGRVNLKEVLKAVSSADEDKEAATVWMETSTGSALTASAAASTAAMAKIGVDKVKLEKDSETGASSEEVARLNKQLSDLNEVASSRDQQIQKVSFYLLVCFRPQMLFSFSHFFN